MIFKKLIVKIMFFNFLKTSVVLDYFLQYISKGVDLNLK